MARREKVYDVVVTREQKAVVSVAATSKATAAQNALAYLERIGGLDEGAWQDYEATEPEARPADVLEAGDELDPEEWRWNR